MTCTHVHVHVHWSVESMVYKHVKWCYMHVLYVHVCVHVCVGGTCTCIYGIQTNSIVYMYMYVYDVHVQVHVQCMWITGVHVLCMHTF